MKQKYEYETVEMDDEIMIIPLGDEPDMPHGVLRLNQTAFEIFTMLKEEISTQEIIDSYVKKYCAISPQAEQDIIECLQKLKETGLVE